jgi:hypothetical protein
MGVRADWHEDAVVAPALAAGSSPFDLASSDAMAALPLDMTVEQVGEELVRLLHRERFLFDTMKIECPIKDRCDTSCIACPLNEAHDPESRKGRLCQVGMDQERFETLHGVMRAGLLPEPAVEAEPEPQPAAAEPEPALKW